MSNLNRTVYTTISGQRHLDREHQRAVAKIAAARRKVTAPRVSLVKSVDL